MLQHNAHQEIYQEISPILLGYLYSTVHSREDKISCYPHRERARDPGSEKPPPCRRAESREQRAESREQRAEGRGQRVIDVLSSKNHRRKTAVNCEL